MARYAIVIVTYNSEKEIRACINSVVAHTDSCEVVVVDNASSDITLEEIPQYDCVRTITNHKNLGYSAAINQGIRQTTAEYVITLNPDTRVYPLWADRMAAHFNSLPDIGAVGPLSTYCIGYQSALKVIGNHPEAELAELVLSNPRAHDFVKLVIGFCMMTRRGILNRVGLLDENLFLGNDDLEFCWRLRCYGYRCLVARDAFIAHDLQKSFVSNPKATALVQESTDALYRKLHKYFKGNVPNSKDIWGIDWFKPSEEVVRGLQKTCY